MPERHEVFAFIGSYAESDEIGIHVLAIDPSGVAEVRGGVAGVRNPSFLTIHPDRRHLYVVSETGRDHDGSPGSVHAFDISWSVTGPELSWRGSRSTGGDGPCNVGVDEAGQWLAVTNYGSGEVVVFPITPDGDLEERVCSVRHAGRGPNRRRQERPHPHSVAFAPGGGFLLVADLGTDEVVTYAVAPDSGELSGHRVDRMQPGAGPRLVRFHPSGDLVCIVNELDNTLTLARWDPSGGALEMLQTLPTLPAGFASDNIAAGLAFDESSVFVSNRGHDSIAGFSLTGDGEMESIGWFPSGGRWPRAIEVDPDGRHLVVANEHSDGVAVISLPGSPTLTAVAEVASPTAISFLEERASLGAPSR